MGSMIQTICEGGFESKEICAGGVFMAISYMSSPVTV